MFYHALVNYIPLTIFFYYFNVFKWKNVPEHFIVTLRCLYSCSMLTMTNKFLWLYTLEIESFILRWGRFFCRINNCYDRSFSPVCRKDSAMEYSLQNYEGNLPGVASSSWSEYYSFGSQTSKRAVGCSVGAKDYRFWLFEEWNSFHNSNKQSLGNTVSSYSDLMHLYLSCWYQSF